MQVVILKRVHPKTGIEFEWYISQVLLWHTCRSKMQGLAGVAIVAERGGAY